LAADRARLKYSRFRAHDEVPREVAFLANSGADLAPRNAAFHVDKARDHVYA
jgi:hypothetical protein